MGQQFIDITGQRFGKLTAVRYVGKDDSKYRYRLWDCICDCGKSKIVTYRNLKRGNVLSCGCIMRAGLMRGGMNKRNYGEARFNDLYLAYRRRAEYKGIVFELTKEDFRALTKSNCYYCGQPPSQIVKAGNGVNGEYLYSGIDRVNNDLGYAISNVRPCCKQCNIAKGILTEAEFYAWIRRVAARLVEVNS